MRLLVIVLTFLLFVGIIGFVLTNLDTRVPVTVWETRYEELPLFLLGIVAVFVGICCGGAQKVKPLHRESIERHEPVGT